MASLHAHPALSTQISDEHGGGNSFVPILTNPDLLLPDRGNASSPRVSYFLGSENGPSPSSATTTLSPLPAGSFEIGTANPFLMPMRPRQAPPLTNPPAYSRYEHGAPLSDIGEEDTSPRSRRARSRTPSPLASSPTLAHLSAGGWNQKSQKRLSDISTCSGLSTGSDLHWEGFDTTLGISDRLRADLAAAADDSDDFGNRRDSVAILGDDENTTQALSERAEQILADAKKRLTKMEGNLSKARTSLLVPPKSSPTFGEFKPVGGLYRSISQAGDHRKQSQTSNLRRSKPLHSPTNGASQAHTRNSSETLLPSTSARTPKSTEVRSASAMEYGYGSRSIDSLLSERSTNALPNGHSPASRSPNSPLTVLREDEGSSWTDFTSPDSFEKRVLGIRNDDSRPRKVSDEHGYGLTRSQSQMSTREILDQLNGLKNKIAGLRTGQRADQNRRSSLQNLRALSSSAEPEEWYAGAAEYQGGDSPLSTNAGTGFRYNKDIQGIFPKSQTPPRSPKSSTLPMSPRSPISVKEPIIDTSYKGVIPTTYLGHGLHPYSSNPHAPPTLETIDRDRDGQDSYIQDSHYEDALQERYDEVEEPVAASEEEQIYLNEVLEESLQDAEPDIPTGANGLNTMEPERHEDRADAFDYENFFLHSALGNYSQAGFRRRRTSHSTAVSRMSFESNDSVETTRAPQAEENGGKFEKEQGEGHVAGNEVTQDTTLLKKEPWTSTGANVPFAQHFRSNSTDSSSTAATFATATEGDNDSEAESDTVPSEILQWGQRPQPSIAGAWPSSPEKSRKGVANLTNGHASPLGTNLPSANPILISVTHPPTQPASSSHQHQQRDEVDGKEEDVEASISASSSPRHPANTSVLISALITLANPNFKSTTGAFSNIDKDLVVNVLRSVGAVCEGINAADARGDEYETRVWRRRLEMARRILEGEIEVEDE